VSRLLERARGRRGELDNGFTLIEIVVAISIVALAAAGTVPLLIVGMRAATASRLNTQAKNLAQQRMESMRDLQFHVDRQNGPFVDLLDIYYTNLSTTPATRTRANETEVGKWVSGGAAAPAPSGPLYQVSVAALPGFPAFSQTIYTQFLTVAGGVVPASSPSFTGYDSQTEGQDQPPTSLVGVTVVTTWKDHGVSHSYASYTRISDSRGLVSNLSSQASGEFMRLSSTGAAGNSLTVDLATSVVSGNQSTGSTSSADVRALQANDAAGVGYLGASGVSTSPSGTGSLNSPVAAFTAQNNGDCGWVGAGSTQVSDVTSATSSGLPQVPSDIDTAVPPLHQVSAQLSSGGNGQCGIFGFANQSTSYASNLMLDNELPLVRIKSDANHSVVVNGSAWANASALTSVPHTVTSGASASSTQQVQLFPGAGFVTDGGGVVDVSLTQATIACSSAVANGSLTQSATGSWTVTIDYWKSSDLLGHGQRITLPTYTWSSATGSGSADPLAAISPASIVVYQNGVTILHLSDFIASWNTARSLVENSASGVHQLAGVVAITTQPVRSGDILSALGMQLGNLSCVADDER
jgi:prepilin-type N-terminal cleavage/methylation domain-containing protein